MVISFVVQKIRAISGLMVAENKACFLGHVCQNGVDAVNPMFSISSASSMNGILRSIRSSDPGMMRSGSIEPPYTGSPCLLIIQVARNLQTKFAGMMAAFWNVNLLYKRQTERRGLSCGASATTSLFSPAWTLSGNLVRCAAYLGDIFYRGSSNVFIKSVVYLYISVQRQAGFLPNKKFGYFFMPTV